MDIVAAMFAYLAGVGAVFAGLAISFFVFFSSPSQTIQPQNEPPSATAMLVRPSAVTKAVAAEGNAKSGATPSEKQAAAASSDPAQKFYRHKASASAARLRRLVQEERARRWAYQQDSSFSSRFLGYAE